MYSDCVISLIIKNITKLFKFVSGECALQNSKKAAMNPCKIALQKHKNQSEEEEETSRGRINGSKYLSGD